VSQGTLPDETTSHRACGIRDTYELERLKARSHGIAESCAHSSQNSLQSCVGNVVWCRKAQNYIYIKYIKTDDYLAVLKLSAEPPPLVEPGPPSAVLFGALGPLSFALVPRGALLPADRACLRERARQAERADRCALPGEADARRVLVRQNRLRIQA
jgi:hypothetical protein